MAASGVQSLRFALYWGAFQPYATWNDVPAAQRAQFSERRRRQRPDPVRAARHARRRRRGRGLSLLPSVLAAPPWDGKGPSNANTLIPRRTAPYANFLTVAHPSVRTTRHLLADAPSEAGDPLVADLERAESSTSLWPTQPFAQDYVTLLRVAHAAIKQADPGAKVVLAGFPSAPGFTSWDYLNQVYRIRRARGQFDVAAVHPYTKQPAGVITIIGLMRR